MKIVRGEHGYILWALTTTGWDFVDYIPFECSDIDVEMLLELD